MSGMEQKGAVSVALPLVRFIEDRALPGTGLDAAAFWAGFSELFERLAPDNAALLAKRDRLRVAVMGGVGDVEDDGHVRTQKL